MPKILIESTFDGHNTKRDGAQHLKFKIPFAEIGNGVKMILSIQKGISARIIFEDKTVVKIGRFFFERMSVDRDGETTLTLASDVNSSGVDADILRSLVNKSIILRLNFKMGDDED